MSSSLGRTAVLLHAEAVTVHFTYISLASSLDHCIQGAIGDGSDSLYLLSGDDNNWHLLL